MRLLYGRCLCFAFPVLCRVRWDVALNTREGKLNHRICSAFGSGSGVFHSPLSRGGKLYRRGLLFMAMENVLPNLPEEQGRGKDRFLWAFGDSGIWRIIRAVGLHFQSGRTDRNAVRPDYDCVGLRRGLFGVAGIEVDERDNGERLAKRVYVVSEIKGQAGRLESRKEVEKTEKTSTCSVNASLKERIFAPSGATRRLPRALSVALRRQGECSFT